MIRTARLVALLAGGALVCSGAVGTATTASAATGVPVKATGTMVLKHDVLAHPSTYASVGRTPGDTPVEIDVTIRRPHVAQELAAYHAMYTKGSGSYHHFLSVAQFDQRFGVPKQQYDAVRDFATAHGLHVVGHPGSNDIVRLAGTASQAEKTFDVTLRDYKVTDPTKSADPQAKKGLFFHANTTGPTVPKGLDIQGVIGLNSLLRMHIPQKGLANTQRVAGPAPHGQKPSSEKPAQGMCGVGDTVPLPDGVPTPGSDTCLGLTTPQDLWAAYDQPGGYNGKPKGNLKVDFGQGQQMAVFGEGRTNAVVSNLRIFEKIHKLPRMPVEVVRTDGKKAKYDDNAGELEWELDTQSSTGMSPDALREVLYFGKDLSDADVLGVFSTWADDAHGPMQANASYGECEENLVGDATNKVGESGLPDADMAEFSSSAMFTLKGEATLRKATMLGKSLFSSAGDTGSSCPVVPAATLNGLTNEAVPIVNYPASSPYAVDVGGTVLYTNKSSHKRALEYAWTYTGGGTSQVFAKPEYQDGIDGILPFPCAYTPGGISHAPGNVGKPCRGVPDVAAQSGDVATNGYGIVSGGNNETSGGGTSLSSPLWMGMWTRIQAANPATRSCSGKVSIPRTLGFANPVLYKAFKGKHGSRDFFDIGGTSGKTLPLGNGLFTATPGWDYVSGMGTPDVSNLIRDITGSKSLAPANPVLPEQPAAASSQSRGDACTPLFTDPPGDDSYPLGMNQGGNPQLDILGGNIDYVTKDGNGNAGKYLKTVLVLKDLSKDRASPAGGGNEYYFLWSYKGKQYFSNVEVGTTGMVTYHDGTVDGTTYTNSDDDDVTGEFNTGKKGTVVVYVPLKDVGKPAKGETLTAPGAQTKVLAGTSETGGLIEVADNASAHYDYQVGKTCANGAGIDKSNLGRAKSTKPPYPVVYGNHKKHEPSAGPTPKIVKSAPPKVVNGCHPSKGGNGPGGHGGGTPPGEGNGGGQGGGPGGNGGPHGPANEASVAHGNLASTGLDGAVPIAAAVLVFLGLGGIAWWRRRAGG